MPKTLQRALPTTSAREAGSAYIISLMVLFLLTILGLSVSLVTQTEVLAGSQERTIERTFYAAEAGVEMSIARALGQGDFGPAVHEAHRNELEQGRLMAVDERVQSSTFFCMGDTPCNFCSINQGREFVRRNHMLSVNAVRQGTTPGGEEVPLGRKSLSTMVDVEPFQTVVSCLSELPGSATGFRFDEF